MARSLNRMEGIGNLGGDPTVNTTRSGDMVASFSVALNEQWTDAQGTAHKDTVWVKCNAWRKRAEIAAQYLKQGMLIWFDGKLRVRKWTNRENVEQTSVEVDLNNFVMLSGKNEEEGERQEPQQDQSVEYPSQSEAQAPPAAPQRPPAQRQQSQQPQRRAEAPRGAQRPSQAPPPSSSSDDDDLPF